MGLLDRYRGIRILKPYGTQHDTRGTVQYSTVQYSTVQYSTVQYSKVQYSTVKYSTVQSSTVQYSTVQYIQYSTVDCPILCKCNFRLQYSTVRVPVRDRLGAGGVLIPTGALVPIRKLFAICNAV